MTPGTFDVAIIGGGIIGLATAMTLARDHPKLRVAIIEKEPEIGLHQTGHNSGVIHAGIYYAPGSRKANLCATGGAMLRRFCDEHGVEYDLCGKLIVAVDESQTNGLEQLYRRGVANGAVGLRMVGPDEMRELEPHAAGVRAMHSPNTGIVDYGAVTRALATEVMEGGGELLTGTEVVGIGDGDGTLRIETTRGDLAAGRVINCAGLHADSIARLMGLDAGVRIIPFRGEFFSLRGEASKLVRGLIYPVPDPNLPFLGVHFTRRVDGTVEAGPNAVLAFAREGYRKTDLDLGEMLSLLTYTGFWRMAGHHWATALREQYRSAVKGVFVRSLQVLVPEVRKGDLVTPSAGVRAQAVDRRGRLLQDFSIHRTATSIHVLNAPSPAATACLSIAEHIVGLADEAFDLAS